MKAILWILLLCPMMLCAFELKDIEASVQQNGLYFQSDRVTIAGVGGGLSLEADVTEHLYARSGFSLLWINGNALETDIGFSYQRCGTWTPSAGVTGKLLWGQRTEIVASDGSLPANPTWMAGIDIAPLRFKMGSAHISLLEIEAGIGAYKGMMLSLKLLRVGM